MSNSPEQFDGRSRRDVKNILVRPRQQFKYAFVFFGGSLVLLMLYIVTFLFFLSRSLTSLAISYGIERDIINTLNSSLTTASYATVGFTVALAGVMFMAGIVLSHRVFGPIVPLARLMDQLREGKYDSRGKLRTKDEFQELMSGLNALAETLETRHGSDQSARGSGSSN